MERRQKLGLRGLPVLGAQPVERALLIHYDFALLPSDRPLNVPPLIALLLFAPLDFCELAFDLVDSFAVKQLPTPAHILQGEHPDDQDEAEGNHPQQVDGSHLVAQTLACRLLPLDLLEVVQHQQTALLRRDEHLKSLGHQDDDPDKAAHRDYD